MSDNVVRLRTFRKAKARSEAEKRAEENRIRFGQTKAEKQARKAESIRADKAHEGGRIAPREPEDEQH
ncbi:MAG: hypothetical protein CTY25_06605 [Methylobacterium sp.]|nr:MAG: hypothetical protein CTY25_06605 [Methylobacterium sp.]